MRPILNFIIVLLFLGAFALEADAQYYRNQGYWKQNRLSFVGGLGASNFLGELGGRDQIGSDFIWDLETKEFKPALSAGIRYVTTRKSAIRAQLSFAILAGDDKLTKEPFRRNRNLHFQSSIIELAAIYEYVLYNVRAGHRFNLTGVKGKKPRAAELYAFGGIAGFRFNPKAKVGDEWIALKPLGTEGQNLRDGADPYSLIGIALPFGIGYRWQLATPGLMVGVEIGHRMTFTDYIDDVSTVYHDPEELGSQPGLSPIENEHAVNLADPSNGFLETEDGIIPVNSTFEGAQRGDPEDNDAYFFAQATVRYQISKKPYRKRRFSSKKGKRVVF